MYTTEFTEIESILECIEDKMTTESYKEVTQIECPFEIEFGISHIFERNNTTKDKLTGYFC